MKLTPTMRRVLCAIVADPYVDVPLGTMRALQGRRLIRTGGTAIAVNHLTDAGREALRAAPSSARQRKGPRR